MDNINHNNIQYIYIHEMTVKCNRLAAAYLDLEVTQAGNDNKMAMTLCIYLPKSASLPQIMKFYVTKYNLDS